MLPWEPLFYFKRGEIPEVCVHGFSDYVPFKKYGALPQGEIIGRSLLKPWQAMATVFDGVVKRHDAEFALVFASHSGECLHSDKLQVLARQLEVDLSDLECPASYPMDARRAAEMVAGNIPKDPKLHACSGKHTAMIWAAKKYGASPKGYLRPEHPLQQKVRSVLERNLGGTCRWTTDSCGLPAAIVPLAGLVSGYQTLARDDGIGAANIKELWCKHPVIMGGSGRLDSDLALAFPNDVIAKEGADGLLIVQSLVTGGSVFVKIASGYQSKYMALGLLEALRRSGPGLDHTFLKVKEWAQSKVNEWVPSDQKIIFASESR